MFIVIVIATCNVKHEKVVTVDCSKVGSIRVEGSLLNGRSLVIRKTSVCPSLF